MIYPTFPILVTTEGQVNRTISNNQTQALLPFNNDAILWSIHGPNQVAPVNGGILVVDMIDEGSYPITGFVGDGIGAPNVLVDLNNIYNRANRQNKDLLGEERIRMLEYRGVSACKLERFRKVPLDLEVSQIVAPMACFNPADLDCNDTVEILDIIRDIEGFGSKVGDFCFNSDLDLNSDGRINIFDIISVIVSFGTSN
jgi:hypothetical protein